jgi:hypothetical protein
MKRKRPDKEEESDKSNILCALFGSELKNLYVPNNYCHEDMFGVACWDVVRWLQHASPESRHNLWIVDDVQECGRLGLLLSGGTAEEHRKRSIYPVGLHHTASSHFFEDAKTGITMPTPTTTMSDWLAQDDLSLSYQRNLRVMVFSVWNSDKETRDRGTVLKIWNRYSQEHPYLLKTLDPFLPVVLQEIVGEYFSVDTRIVWLPTLDRDWPSVLPRERFDRVFEDSWKRQAALVLAKKPRLF